VALRNAVHTSKSHANRHNFTPQLAALAYPACLGLQAVHELGHVLHAAASGGRVAQVDLPLVGFSRTEVFPNPHPLFVAWGGVLWGSVLPVLAWRLVPRRFSGTRAAAGAFAGLCLTANGAYLAVGWVDRVGDAGDLMKWGTPVWVMACAGSVGVAAGLWVWHRLTGTAVPTTARRCPTT
jgi:hypothetical protein